MMCAEKIQPRQEVLRTAAAHHGALDYTELEILGLSADDLLDFSVNSNPYGPSPMVREAIQSVSLDRYPDRDAVGLRRKLSRRFNMDPNRFVVGNGTSELIQLISFAFLDRGDRALVLAHTFGEYQRSIQMMGARLREFQTYAASGFQVEMAGLRAELETYSPKVFFLCNPNNPTGSLLEADSIEAVVKDFPQTLFVVDEAYIQFADSSQSVIDSRAENLIVLRSMTKDYGLAGLRLGYAAGSETIIKTIGRVRPAWNVNAMAQAAGIAALQDVTYLQHSLEKLKSAREEFWQDLARLGADLVPSSTHYCIIKVGNGGACRSELMRSRIQVRDCFSFDLPAYIRIATKTPKENSVMVAALRSVKEQRGELIF